MPPPVDLRSLLNLLRRLLEALAESLARQYFAHAVETRQTSGPDGAAARMMGRADEHAPPHAL